MPKDTSENDPRATEAPKPSDSGLWLPQDVEEPHYWRRFLTLCRSHFGTIVACMAVLVFLAVLEDIFFGDIVRLDALGYRYIVESRREWLTPIMTQITSLASPVVMLVMLVVVAAFAPGKRPGMCATANLVAVVALNEAMKFVIQRPRPDGFRLIAETGYSFPSGHSMVSMAFYGLLVWMIWRYEEDRALRVLWSAFLCLTIAAVGVSRVYLGVHYMSDVVAGFCVSLVWLAFYTKVVAPVFLKKPVNPPKHPRHIKTA